MICYKDKTFCINEECKHYKKCDRNYEKAKLERDCHSNQNVRDLGIMVAKFKDCYEEK